MINQFPFKVLFWFENDSKIITEIKRTDIQSEDKSVIYKWIIIRKERSENENWISILTFQSMESSGENQTRTFAEGILHWDSENVDFNGEKMNQVESKNLSIEALEVIASFLNI